MEGLSIAAREFLEDRVAVAAALEVDLRREPALAELRDAFQGFRDADESIHRLARRIQGPLGETVERRGNTAQNLWGFHNEDERLFPERFAAAAPRLPEVDLASVLRNYLDEDAQRTDEQRIQLLLAFGEFVASLDARNADGEPRLGVGPAANFLTFAWHCLSDGREPVFLFGSSKAIRTLSEVGVLDADATALIRARGLEGRFQTFFRVSRHLGDALTGAPEHMRPGWAVEHALEWCLQRVERAEQLGDSTSGMWRARPAEPTTNPGGRPVIVVPSSGAPAPTSGGPSSGMVRIERPRVGAPDEPRTSTRTEPRTEPRSEPREAARVAEPEPRDVAVAAAASAEPKTDPRPATLRDDDTNPGTDGQPKRRLGDESRAKQRDRVGQITKKRVLYASDQNAPLLEKSGVDLADAMPADRTPPTGMPRPLQLEPEPARGESRYDAKPEPASRTEARVEPAPARDRFDGRVIETRIESRPATDPRPRVPEAPRAPSTDPRGKTTPTTTSQSPTQSPTTSQSQSSTTSQSSAPAAVGAPAARSPARPAQTEAEDSGEDVLDQLVGELRGEVVQASRGEPRVTSGDDDRLARDLHLDPALVDELQAALEQRGRALLVGPAFTGKTHVARRLAIHAAGHLDRVLVIRLHPELGYSELMGRRGDPGVVGAFCERARKDRDHRHVLVLDELDRGDAARSLGELVGGLAERGQEVHLASGGTFSVPRNLLVLATARDLPADPALVGRFPVVPLPADPEVLRRFLSDCRPALEWVADLLKTLNTRLGADGHPARVGHGVFMDAELDPSRLRQIWRREVVPLLVAQGVSPDALDFDALRA